MGGCNYRCEARVLVVDATKAMQVNVNPQIPRNNRDAFMSSTKSIIRYTLHMIFCRKETLFLQPLFHCQ